MSKRKYLFEDKIYAVNLSGWKRKPTANCRYMFDVVSHLSNNGFETMNLWEQMHSH